MTSIALIAAALVSAPLQEKPEEKLQPLLKKLSEFAREVDAGKRTLRSLVGSENKPEAWLVEFRSLVHEHAKLNPAVLEYLKSKEEPLGARALAVLALAHPHKDSVAELMGSVYTEPLDPKLVITAVLCYQNLHGSEFDWVFPLRLLGAADISPAWRYPQMTIAGPPRIIIGAPEHVNLIPMLEGLLARLAKGESGVLEHRSLSLAWEFSRRKQATEDHRQRVRPFMERACLDGKAGWHAAIEYFCSRNRKPEEADIDIVGKSLEKVETFKKAYALEEIVVHFPGSLYKEPFTKYHDEMIAYLSKTEKEGGREQGTFGGIVWALLNQPGADERAEFMLFKSPSITLRRRACGEVSSRCGYVKKSVGWDRWSPQLKRMLLDSDFYIGFAAAHAVAHELERRDSEFTRADRSLWWSRATEWVSSRKESTLDPRNSALLEEVRHRLSNRKP